MIFTTDYFDLNLLKGLYKGKANFSNELATLKDTQSKRDRRS